jgi:hypothetical protein
LGDNTTVEGDGIVFDKEMRCEFTKCEGELESVFVNAGSIEIVTFEEDKEVVVVAVTDADVTGIGRLVVIGMDGDWKFTGTVWEEEEGEGEDTCACVENEAGKYSSVIFCFWSVCE